MKLSVRFYPSILLLFALTFLLLRLPFAALTSTSTDLPTNETDHLALKSFQSLLSDPLKALQSWNQTTPLCQWQGVTCGRKHPDRVTSLWLSSLDLTGPISPHLANLTFLRFLRLDDNNLHGNLPPELGRLSRLRNLNLSMNYLQGEIPATISQCIKLRFVDLRSNLFTGEIFKDIGSLSELWILNLGENNLTGSIPPSIGNLSSLFGLLLRNNYLYGSMPQSMGGLVSLEYLQIANNLISGEIPSSLYNLSSLLSFAAGNNHLEGRLSSSMFNTLVNLDTIILHQNWLRGRIPDSISNASNLVEFDVEQNSFSGVVPSKLGNLRYLYWLNLDENNLEANKISDWDFLTSLTNCSLLETLLLEFNRFGSVLPASIANLSSIMTTFAIGWNQISGTIPAGIGNLVNLTVLGLNDNQLTGRLPSTIGRLKDLHTLSLAGNRLTGQIPSSIGNLTLLNLLYLDSNEFSGSIPASLGQCKSLEELNISQNNLSGAIPKELVSISSLTKHLGLSSNSLSGMLPPEIGNLKNLAAIAISDNKLSGTIPNSLGDCQSMEYLYMQGNLFEGTIPQSLQNLKGLEELDLSRNRLSGEIPEFLEKLGALYQLNLSFNDLTGEVPSKGVFSNTSAVSVLGNSKLCGGNQGLNLPMCNRQSNRKHLPVALNVIVPIIAGLLALIILAVIYVIVRRKNLKKKTSFKSSLDEQFTKVSFSELQRATDRFSESNLIGVGSFGSVYKGVLATNTTVAVKVLNLQRHGALKSFMAECEALRNTRHRNLLKIFTSCSSLDSRGNDFKALILEYMPNGSLDNWLHQKEPENSNQTTLSTLQRLDIAIDVASALDYLHHHGHLPIVHCDLKPSNILLDEDMSAHVSDFGLAKVLWNQATENNQNFTKSLGIKGTIGYVAPEYGMGGEASTHGDVYSYGIALLELFTGKRPTDDMFHDGLNLHQYVKMNSQGQVLDIVDPNLLFLEDGQEAESNTDNDGRRLALEKCMDSVIRIGVACSEEDPQERKQMGEVIKELNAVKDLLLKAM
ncbi:uncharacterized protein [Typha latifolia]|uniref:uncharacterized protein n=1 Tax=Typha latifolia TaxID=4733 RepID=UPI003C2BCC7B